MKAIAIIGVLLVLGQICLGDEITRSKYPFDTAELCRTYGYPAEEHIVRTRDGYELKIFRIPFGIENTQKRNRIPILILHGLDSNSNCFILRGANDLVFQLVEDGFEIWLGNFRGSRFARNLRYSRNNKRYWNYCSDDIAKYDLSAIIDYILWESRQPNLALITMSSGGPYTAMLLTDQPAYNSVVIAVFMVAPTVYTMDVEVRTKMDKGPESYNSTELYKLYMRTNTAKAVEPTSVLERVTKKIDCSTANGIRPNCIKELLHPFGGYAENFNQSLFNVFTDNFGDGLSAGELIESLQHQESGEFKKFDSRPFNEFPYHNGKSSLYDLRKLTPPLFIYYGPGDRRVSRQNLDRLCSEAKNCRKLFPVPDDKFGHIDYFMALNTNEVFSPVIRQDINTILKSKAD